METSFIFNLNILKPMSTNLEKIYKRYEKRLNRLLRNKFIIVENICTKEKNIMKIDSVVIKITDSEVDGIYLNNWYNIYNTSTNRDIQVFKREKYAKEYLETLKAPISTET